MSINTRFAHIAAPTADELAVARYMAADQFMGHCWSLSFDYEEYAFHAARLQYRVYTEAEYIDYCRSQDEQTASYFAPAASALHTITTNVHGTNVPVAPVVPAVAVSAQPIATAPAQGASILEQHWG